MVLRDGKNEAPAELLLQRMKAHIDAVAGRYRGRIAMWDVVNEALDDGTNYLRPSGWSKACGEEFIVKAFEYAHAADPKALLIYNDYNNELPAKREKLIRLGAGRSPFMYAQDSPRATGVFGGRGESAALQGTARTVRGR